MPCQSPPTSIDRRKGRPAGLFCDLQQKPEGSYGRSVLDGKVKYEKISRRLALVRAGFFSGMVGNPARCASRVCRFSPSLKATGMPDKSGHKRSTNQNGLSLIHAEQRKTTLHHNTKPADPTKVWQAAMCLHFVPKNSETSSKIWCQDLRSGGR